MYSNLMLINTIEHDSKSFIERTTLVQTNVHKLQHRTYRVGQSACLSSIVCSHLLAFLSLLSILELI